MKPFVTLLALITISVLCHAQIDFQPGYYIRNDGTKISCQIKDYGWHNNPRDIVCKSTPDAAPTTIGMAGILEFGVGNAKYQRFEVDVDTSSQMVEYLSSSPFPEYRHETALLKLLVEGKASLYVYRNKDVTRFFFKMADSTLQPLVFKQFVTSTTSIGTNDKYIEQLRYSLNCSSPEFQDPGTLRYEERSLARFFIAYNQCVKSAYTDYWVKTGKSAVHLNIRPGLDLTSVRVTDFSGSSPVNIQYGTKASFRLGAELEIMLPFNRNKWAVVLEPAYRSYSASPSYGREIDYKAAQFIGGFRYFMFAGGSSKLYLGGSGIVELPLHSTVLYGNINLGVEPSIGAAVSAGYRYGDRVSIELKYAIAQHFLDNYTFIGADMSGASLIFSYRIL